MKQLTLLIVICCAIPIFLYCEQQKHFIQGAWEMVYAQVSTPDTTIVIDLSRYVNPDVKIYTNSYYAWGHQRPNGLPSAGGGTYKVVGDSVTEFIKYHSDSSSVNQTFTCRVWMQNDTLHLQGKYQKYEMLEKYIRLE